MLNILKERSRATSFTAKEGTLYHKEKQTSHGQGSIKNIFSPFKKAKLANSTQGLHAKNKKFHIVTLNDLVEALLHDRKVKREDEIKKAQEMKDSFSEDN